MEDTFFRKKILLKKCRKLSPHTSKKNRVFQLNMGKVKITVYVEKDVYEMINKIARDSYGGSKSTAMEWITRTVDEENFYRWRAKQSARDLQHCREMLDLFAEKNEDLIKDREITWEYI